MSERRACRVVGQHRSTQRRTCQRPSAEETKIRRRLRAIGREHPRWGWKKAHVLLRRDGWQINRKRTRRLWREEGLRRPPQRSRKTRRTHPDVTERRKAERPNHVWAVDFQFDETSDQRRLKLCNIVDEYTREALAMEVGRTCTSDDVIGIVEGLVAERGAPAFLRSDNGPELVAFALQDWCRLSGVDTLFIEPGSPWQNAYVESFNGRVRDECLNIEEFGSLIEAQAVIEVWRIEYNTYRPHGSLNDLTPEEFREQYARMIPSG